MVFPVMIVINILCDDVMMFRVWQMPYTTHFFFGVSTIFDNGEWIGAGGGGERFFYWQFRLIRLNSTFRGQYAFTKMAI